MAKYALSSRRLVHVSVHTRVRCSELVATELSSVTAMPSPECALLHLSARLSKTTTLCPSTEQFVIVLK